MDVAVVAMPIHLCLECDVLCYLTWPWVYNVLFRGILEKTETNFLPKEWTYDKNLLNINLRMLVFAQKIFYTLFPEKQQKSLKLSKLTTWIYL